MQGCSYFDIYGVRHQKIWAKDVVTKRRLFVDYGGVESTLDMVNGDAQLGKLVNINLILFPLLDVHQQYIMLFIYPVFVIVGSQDVGQIPMPQCPEQELQSLWMWIYPISMIWVCP